MTARLPCTECRGLGCIEGITCERCDGSCVEPVPALPPMPRRGVARRQAATRPNAGALLEAVAEALDARELPRVAVISDARGPRWLTVDGEIVANVKGDLLILRAVRHGIQHGEYVIPEAEHTPTGKEDEAKGVAMDIQVRIIARAAERAKLEASRAHVCAEDNQGLCHRCGVVLNLDRAEPRLLVSVAGALEQAERASGLRGRYTVHSTPHGLRISWIGESLNTRIENEALGAAVRALTEAGYEAARAPGFPWVQVTGVVAAIGADEPGIHHEHGRDTERPMANAAE